MIQIKATARRQNRQPTPLYSFCPLGLFYECLFWASLLWLFRRPRPPSCLPSDCVCEPGQATTTTTRVSPSNILPDSVYESATPVARSIRSPNEICHDYRSGRPNYIMICCHDRYDSPNSFSEPYNAIQAPVTCATQTDERGGRDVSMVNA